jgi:hypothetical protein
VLEESYTGEAEYPRGEKLEFEDILGWNFAS